NSTSVKINSMTVFYYTLDFVNKNTKSNFFETYFKDVSCETIIAVKNRFSFAYHYRVPYDNG
ncbi:hypothetical protein, partial [Lactobacillus gasseri]